MNGPIAQLVSLALHGNAMVRDIPTPRFWPKNSTCQFCDRITFVDQVAADGQSSLIAGDPDEWLAAMRSRGVREFRIGHRSEGNTPTPERMHAGFVGGGGVWVLETRGSRSEKWLPRWEVWNQDAPDSRIWRVEYRLMGESDASRQATPDLELVTQDLARSLADVHAFASRHDLDGFASLFAKASETLLAEETVLHGYHRDLAPVDALPGEAARLLDAAQSAWVFGGMGSWNDIWFEGDDGAEYERVSEGLFRAVLVAIPAAVDASTPKGDGMGEGRSQNALR